MRNSNNKWAVLWGVGALVWTVSFGAAPIALAVNVQILAPGSTSTFITVFSQSSTVAGFAQFTYTSSSRLFTVTGTSSFQGFTFTNATGTGNLQAATMSVVGTGASVLQITGTPPQSSSTALIQIGSSTLFKANASGTFIGINVTSSFTGDFLNFQIASTSKFSVSGAGLASTTELRTPSSTIGTLTVTGALTDVAGNKYSTSTPAGSSTQIQFNASGVFAATSTFTFTTSTQQLKLGHTSSSLLIGDKFTNVGGGNTVVTFNYTGATSSWTVPAGVTSVTIEIRGGAGGENTASDGNGGTASGTLSVTPGNTYYYCVGGRGSPRIQISGSAGAAGGFCGGGQGGQGVAGQWGGGGGGGMSWFGTDGTFSTSTAIILGAGGGGTAGGMSNGNGGGLTGQAGGNGASSIGGGGGSQSGGGSGGNGAPGAGNGTSGSAGQGGTGGAAQGGSGGWGGGGGAGGYFGGGGGGGGNSTDNGSTGGGGSSFLAASLTSASTTQGGNNATGSIILTYSAPQNSDLASSTYSLAVGGHIITGGNVPSVSSCGTAPLVSGDDTAGVVTIGSGTVTSCTVTFTQVFVTAPICTATDNTSFLAIKSPSTTSTLVLSATSTFAGDNINYICLGY